MSRHPLRVVLLLLGACLAPLSAFAQHRGDPPPLWLGAGLGTGTFRSLDPAPSAGRDGLAASIEMGYRVRKDWGVGLEFGAILPAGGCAQWECGERADFAPNFGRFSTFAEYHPGRSGLRLRAGVGLSRFCYRRHWEPDGWSWADTLAAVFYEDLWAFGGTGAWQCDAARRALAGSVSVGYDWPLARMPATLGVRLTAEAANYAGKPTLDMPAFRHRAVLLTLHFTLQ